MVLPVFPVSKAVSNIIMQEIAKLVNMDILCQDRFAFDAQFPLKIKIVFLVLGLFAQIVPMVFH